MKSLFFPTPDMFFYHHRWVIALWNCHFLCSISRQLKPASNPSLARLFLLLALCSLFTHTLPHRIALPPSQGTKQGICWMVIDFIRCSPISLEVLLTFVFYFPLKVMQENINKTFYSSPSQEVFSTKEMKLKSKVQIKDQLNLLLLRMR